MNSGNFLQNCGHLPTGKRVQIRIIARGAQQCAAHSLYRLARQRPATERPTVEPTQRWCSDCGKGRANVTGKSARTVRLHPSGHLACISTEAAYRRSGQTFIGHPAAAFLKGVPTCS